MSKGKIISALLCLGSALAVTGQNSTSSPYSRYGYGSLVDGASAQGRGMGGLSIGLRDNQYTNFANPATYTAIDSLTFRFEVGASLRSSFYSSGDSKSSDLSGNLERIGLMFPIKNWMGVALGIEPYSVVGYNYTDSEKEIAINSEDVSLDSYGGKGGVNQFMIGLGFKPWEHFSFGCNLKFLFGDITTQSQVSFTNSENSKFYHSTLQTNDIDIHDFGVTFGAQYEIEAGEDKSIIIGATIEPKNHLNADASKIVLTSGIDTVETNYDGAFELPLTIGLGASYKVKKRWTFGIDYKLQKWSDAKYFGEKVFEDRSRLSLGAEVHPNHMSKQYFQRVSYRCGFSTANTYYKVHGETNRDNIASAGFGFPLKRGLNPTVINFTVEYGFTTLSNKDMMSDRFLRFVLNATINEKWFVRRRLE